MIPLAGVIAAVEEEGERLRAEFYRAEGPRGRGGSAPIDREIEERLRAKLQALLPCAFAGEETGTTPGTQDGWLWLVDPQDGTSEFLKGRRGSAIAVALLRGNVAVLGVVHSPLSPDRGRDTIAWAEGAGPILRNGAPVEADLSRGRFAACELLWATASAALRPGTFARAAGAARFVAMPSIAYRLARIAAGDGVATLSVHPVHEYDIAAGVALVRAARGTLLDAEGREIALAASAEARVSGVFAGAPEAAHELARFDWGALEAEPKLAPRLALGFPRRDDDARLVHAQQFLLRLLTANMNHDGPLSAVGELALAAARSIARARGYATAAALEAYRDWERSGPGVNLRSVDPLARSVPIGIWAAGDPERAACAAREDAALTHSDAALANACAEHAASIAAAVGGSDRGARSVARVIEPREILRIVSCRPPGRPMEYWPDDALELAEAL